MFRKLVFVLGVFMMFFSLSACKDEGQELPVDGGIVDNSNYQAPKVINSRDISEFSCQVFLERPLVGGDDDYSGFYDFRIKDGLMSESHLQVSCQVDEELLKDLQLLIEENELVSFNGVDKHTSGLAPEYQPMYFKAIYESGEELYFSFNNDPYARWSNKLFDLFRAAFIRHGYVELLPSKQARTICNFRLFFEEEEGFCEFGLQSVDGRVQFYLFSKADGDFVYIDASDEACELLQKMVSECNLQRFHNLEADSSDIVFDLVVDYENGHQICGRLSEGEEFSLFRQEIGKINDYLQLIFAQ